MCEDFLASRCDLRVKSGFTCFELRFRLHSCLIHDDVTAVRVGVMCRWPYAPITSRQSIAARLVRASIALDAVVARGVAVAVTVRFVGHGVFS
jgi:hypothetical protein